MYYIYHWYNIETEEVFYVGLGTGNRRYQVKNRNKLFKAYYRKNKCDVRVYKADLSYDEGRQLEIDQIKELKPCCNMTKGGEKTDGAKISKALTGRTLTQEHRDNVSKGIQQWYKERAAEGKRTINGRKVAVLDKDMKVVRTFDAKYKVGIWLHDELGYGHDWRSAQRNADKHFKTKMLFDDKFYFVEIHVDKH
ncbi:hypothetical protein [Sporolactobacillus nakayamae]|uniref:Group I intron endonuclease n=1 Tax=Sporolactobacillus nakayamae TaxID=269670 RepID=A0A1I2U0A0_9BACL|nr:hypothetical protein [Sporolactobacillus nakayamae]SFG70562.1 hypothetical protein SAMN02982927_02502 [Sporolactobacillus nakayamae]